MKVYVLTSDGGETLRGVFSTHEKAMQANEILQISGTIDEIEIDEIKIKDCLLGRVGGGYSTMQL